MENENKLISKKLRDVEVIRGYLQSDIPVYLHGKSGCGKSARVKEIDPECEVIYLRNATPELINGKAVYVPPLTKKVEVNVQVEENGKIVDKTEYEDVILRRGYMMEIQPAWLKRLTKRAEAEPNRLHVLFFDELSNALPAIQGYIYNIVLDREVNGKWILPSNVRIVAAGNDMEESLAANEIAQPLFSRFAHMYIETTFDNWFDWACAKRIHPAVIAYHYKNKGEFLRTDYTGTSPNCDPRRWEMVSKVLYETHELSVVDNVIEKKVADDFVKFCATPIVPLEAIVENDLYPEATLAAHEFKEGNESLMYVASLSQVDDEHIDEVYQIILQMKPKYRDLFIKMWIGSSKERLEKIKALNNKHLDKYEKVKINALG